MNSPFCHDSSHTTNDDEHSQSDEKTLVKGNLTLMESLGIQGY